MEKREYILGINPCIYGLNYHDPGAAVFSDGKVLFAIEEERLNGIKGSKGVFPSLSIEACLNYCGITAEQITGVAVGYEPTLWMERLQLELNDIISKCKTAENQYDAKKIIERIMQSNLVDRYGFFCSTENINKLIHESSGINNTEIRYYAHHLSHIASSYEFSGFDDAVGVVVDGIGESECTTIWEIHDHVYSKLATIEYPNSLGYFYAIATKFLGFEPWHHEGKTMALAAYGQEDTFILDRVRTIVNIDKPIYDTSGFIKDNSTNFLMIDEEKALLSIEKSMGFPRRKKEDPIDEKYRNFAWAVQYTLETAVLNLVNYAIERTGIKNVCVAGGVFMNCKMNMVIREKSNANMYFVQPLAGDMGVMIGAGLLMSRKYNTSELSLDLGPDYSDLEIEEILKKTNLTYYKATDVAKDVANLLADGKIVCWFEGRMEIGARALGSRSVLGDPRTAEMSERINKLIKHREVWRPFACSVLEEAGSKVFEDYDPNHKYPFMIEAFRVRNEWKSKVPAVIHIADGTSRPQMVSKKTKPLYYKMIKYFEELTGCPLVLNTSFNDKGQPIVLSPQLAIDFFIKNPVDALAIGNYLVCR